MTQAIIQKNPNAAQLMLQLKATLQSDITRVNTFYLRQQSILEQKVALLCKPALSLDLLATNELDHERAESILATCLELRLDPKRLQWYGKVNKDGFFNLLDKLKRSPYTAVANIQLYQCEFSS